jgi:uncharacterized protein YdeI (YjbR/CyaY-like superfamily)
MDERVEAYFEEAKLWRAEQARLRELALEVGLEEAFKWRGPCYMWEGRNVGVIGGFKAHCVFSFFKGALLADPLNLLAKQGPNTEASRSFQFTSLDQIERHANDFRGFIRQAIQIERDGLKVETTPAAAMPVPEEFERRFERDPALKAAFEVLTPGRRKAYFQFVEAAKQAVTRESRIDQVTPRILAGKGLHDCVCGLSKRMPSCDGSHRALKGT